MKASEVMTRNVATVGPESSIRHAAQIMLDRRVSGLPVIDGEGKLAGIVTEGDLLRRSELGIAALAAVATGDARARDYVHQHSWKVGDIMQPAVATIDEDTPLHRIATLMEERQIKRVPVLRGDRLVGIVSRADLLRCIATAKLQPSASGDAAIRLGVETRLREDIGLTGAPPRVTVADGVVHLWGTVNSEAERNAARVAAECMPGVRGIEDHLGIEPAI